MTRATVASRLLPAVGVGVFCVALWLLHDALRGYRYEDVVESLRALPDRAILLALGLSALGYLALTGYDAVALRYIGRRLPYARTAFTSFIAYGVGHSLGFTWLIGGSVRYRLYSGWGLSAGEVAGVVAFCTLTFWLGFLTLAGAVFVAAPPPAPLRAWLTGGSLVPLGVALLALVAAYLGVAALRRRPIRIRQWELPVPGLGLGLSQIAVSSLDWLFAAGTLYVLLPADAAPPYPAVLLAYLLAVVGGLLSQVPGGLGVLEGIVLLLVPGPPAAVLGSLLAYRAVYYLAPLLVALLALGAYEVARAREQVAGVARAVGQAAASVAPQILASTTFLAGAVLLVSGATPAEPARLAWLEERIPLPVIELSHFLASLVGVALLLLARGLQLRLRSAYAAAAALLPAGALLALLKGAAYEEATALVVMLAALLPARRHFHRPAPVVGEAMTPWWAAAIGGALIATAAIGLFAYKHVELALDLWWRVAPLADAPRSLRATAGAGGLLLAVFLLRLLRSGTPEPGPAGPGEVERAAGVVARAREAAAHLALLGDKSLLFSESGLSFLMYRVEGTSWVALGDPVGPASEATELAWRFRELCDRHGASPVFYLARPQMLPVYFDLGLTALEIGEEARVRVEGGVPEAARRAGLAAAVASRVTAGVRFEVAPAGAVPPLLGELRAVSDAWLGAKGTAERGFATGVFEPAYLARTPVALVRRGARIVAFATLWTGADRDEVAPDLVRCLPDVLDDCLEYLCLELLRWAGTEGYRWLGLGPTPLARGEDRAVAPLVRRAGRALFRHGEHFQDLERLRAFKARFDPVWEPRYLAAPSGLALPGVLADVARLVAGGDRG